MILERRVGASGVEEVLVPMIEISSSDLRKATDLELDRILEEFLGLTVRQFWSRARKVSHILSAASQFLDQDEL